MSADMEPAAAGPSTTTGRTSGRVKNKSQRALESEDTAKLLARARERARLAAEGGEPESSTSRKKPRVSKRETKGKREEKEVWCVCESANGAGPMIECGGCLDWFHFGCINLDPLSAERIHKYICPPCEHSTGEKTTRLFDITTFRSPTPPPGLIPGPPLPQKSIPRKRPLVKHSKPTASSNTAPRSGSVDGEHDADAASDSGSGDGSSSAEDHTSSSGSNSDSSVHSTTKSRPAKKPRPSRPARAAVPSAQFYNTDKDKSTPQPPSRAPLKSRPSISKPIAGPAAKKNSGAPGGKMPTLPPARQHVLYKLTEVVRKFFGDAMKGDETEQYATELEAGLFLGFKEVVGGKETAGARYKGQYSMLSSSLQPHLQETTRTAILSRSLTPAQVGVLSSADLASQARADEREEAKRVSLQQTVRQKDAFQGGAIMGREGMERVEQARAAERDQEEARRNAERRKAEEKVRRESIADEVGVHTPDLDNADSPVPVPIPVPTAAAVPSASPAPIVPIFGTGTAKRPHASPSSKVAPSPGAGVAAPSPVKPAFSLTSAWGSGPAGSAAEVLDFSTDTPESIDVDLGVDQTNLDLSDFMAVDEAPAVDYTGPGPAEEKKELSPMEIYQARPVIFSRGLINPNDRAAPTPNLQARALSTLPLSRNFGTEDEWRFLLPGPTLEWTGRVPSAAGVSFLSQMRLSPKWDVFALGLTMGDGQGEEVEGVYSVLLEDYVARDRYAVCLPYGPSPPPRAAKDVYAIPLRPTDKYPDFLDLLDGLTIPAVRDRLMWVLVIVIAREEIALPPALLPAPTSQYPPPPAPAPVAPMPGFTSQYPPPPSAAELLKAQNLEALMRSIGTLPPAPTPPHPQTGYSPATHVGAGGATPYPSYPPQGAPVGYGGWQQPQQQGYDQYAAPGYYPPPPSHQPQVHGWNAPPGPPQSQGYPGGGYGYGQPPGHGQGQGGQRWDDRTGGRGGRAGGQGGDGRGEKGKERERFKPVESDQGWGSRKRGGGGGY